MKNIIIKSIFALILSFCIISCSEELIDKAQVGTIKGLVIKKGTNQPLKNVKISTSPSTETVFTKDDGSFLIENIPLGDYSVRAEISGYLANLQGVNLKNDQQTVSVVFEMSDDTSNNAPPTVPQLLSPIDKIGRAHV